MSLTLPRLSTAVATSVVPASHRVVTMAQRARLARRMAVAAQGRARWHPGQLRQAAVQRPALPAQVRGDEPHSLATPRAVEVLREWLRAAAAQRLLSGQDQAALRGATPDAALAVLCNAVERRAQTLVGEVAAVAGADDLRNTHAPIALHVSPLLALHDSFATGSDARLDGAFHLLLQGQDVGLVEWRISDSIEDRAIRGALDALSNALSVPTVVPCDHGAAMCGSMYVEFASDAVRDARKVDGAWRIDPEAVRNFADEMGFDDTAELEERLVAFAEYQLYERQCVPMAPNAPSVRQWLAGNESAAAILVRRLIALGTLARKYRRRQVIEQEWEGSFGATTGLCISPAGFDDWITEAGSSFYEEDQGLTQTFCDPAQLLKGMPASIVAVAVANLTFTLLLRYLGHGR